MLLPIPFVVTNDGHDDLWFVDDVPIDDRLKPNADVDWWPLTLVVEYILLLLPPLEILPIGLNEFNLSPKVIGLPGESSILSRKLNGLKDVVDDDGWQNGNDSSKDFKLVSLPENPAIQF